MKAVRVVPGPEGGKVEVQDIPVPVVAAGQVLVRVRAAGLNRGEINQAKELRSGNTITTGVEFAGEVSEVGAGVNGWRVGDRVMGHGRGCQADAVKWYAARAAGGGRQRSASSIASTWS